jgi:hypothetical protein
VSSFCGIVVAECRLFCVEAVEHVSFVEVFFDGCSLVKLELLAHEEVMTMTPADNLDELSFIVVCVQFVFGS